MAADSTTIALSRSDLRAVAGYALACARPALAIFERERPDDRRPRAALDAAQAFVSSGATAAVAAWLLAESGRAVLVMLFSAPGDLQARPVRCRAERARQRSRQ